MTSDLHAVFNSNARITCNVAVRDGNVTIILVSPIDVFFSYSTY